MQLLKKDASFLLEPEHQLFNNCHASTIIKLSNKQLLVAYFAGKKEGTEDTAIWLSRYVNNQWQNPIRIIAQEGKAHWNPVLHYQNDRVYLFYKVGPDVHHWITHYSFSDDNGNTWSVPKVLGDGNPLPRGPVKNKLLVMSNGEWAAPSSIENNHYWDSFIDISDNYGINWLRNDIPIVHLEATSSNKSNIWQGLKNEALWESNIEQVFRWDGVIQPTLWESNTGHIHALMRSTRGQIYRSDSVDFGRNWCQAYATTLPNNNSGIDIIKLADGTLILAFNPVSGNWNKRSPISLIYSHDNGKTWSLPFDLESGEGEFSYPAIISDPNEKNVLHITYTWNRKNIVYNEVNIIN